jgi:hypothetical protein
MFARGRRRGACQAAGIAVKVMIAMVLQGDSFAKRGLARMVMWKETVSGVPFQ